MAPSELTDLTAVQAVAAMRGGDLLAETYAAALLDRALAFAHLNVFISLDRDATLAAARQADRRRAAGERLGLLHGLPIPMKDIINTRELPTTGGTGALRGFQPRENAPVAERLLEAGALLMGKTNLHELSYGWTSNNAITGAVHNPYRHDRIPGGSSGGSAAAVAARIAPLSVAEDSLGSIRVPASMCGIAGFRPTFGRYPNEGVIPIAPKYSSTPGPHARSVADLVLFDAAVTGIAPDLKARSLRTVRIGLAPDYFHQTLDPEVERVMTETVRRLTDAGAEFVTVRLPDVAMRSAEIALNVFARVTAPSLTDYLERHQTGVTLSQLVAGMSTGLRGLFELIALPGGAAFASDETFEQALSAMTAMRSALVTFFAENRLDAIAFPGAPLPAPLIGEDEELEIRGQKLSILDVFPRNVAVSNCGSLPGLVVPAGITKEGLPIGVEFDGPAGGDRALLALGLAVEQALPAMPPPPSPAAGL